MVDREVKIKALLARQESERAWLFEHADIIDYLEKATGICGDRFGVSDGLLWGARSISFGNSMGFNKVDPTFQDLRAIANILKPVPMVLIKASCTSFHPKETLTEKDTQYGTTTDVVPFRVTLERTNRPRHTATIEWYAKMLGKLYRMHFHFPDNNCLFGQISKHWVPAHGWGRDRREGEWRCHCSWPADELWRDQKIVANAKQIRWYSAGEYPNYTRYWEATDKRYSLTPIDLINNMDVACAPATA